MKERSCVFCGILLSPTTDGRYCLDVNACAGRQAERYEAIHVQNAALNRASESQRANFWQVPTRLKEGERWMRR